MSDQAFGLPPQSGRGGATSTKPRRVALPPPRLAPTLGWTFFGTLLPGAGLIRAGRLVRGTIVLLFAIGVLGAAAYFVFPGRDRAIALATNPDALRVLAIILLVLALGWILVIGATYFAVRPSNARRWHKVVGVLFAGLLSLTVAAPLCIAAQYSYRTSTVITNVFGDDPEPSAGGTSTQQADPWANKPRINVLVMGGDLGESRDPRLGLRADTVMVASIDTHNGATTLFSLPRQTARIPFPTDSPLHSYYPNGFYDGVNPANAEYFLNAMYNNIPKRIPEGLLGKNVKNVGAEVMKIGVGEALGLGKIDYYVVFTMDGFKDFINAIGGITLNVNYKIPIGGKTGSATQVEVQPSEWIQPGPNKKMDGRTALWYARGRFGYDDYKRLERQRCVINAVVEQTKPTVVLANFNEIASAGENNIITDVPRSLLPSLVDLALKVKDTKLHSVVFKPGVASWQSSNPNWPVVRGYVKKAIKETESDVSGTTKSSASPSTTASASPSKKASASPTKSSTTGSDDLSDVCAYHPQA